jgi:25S rRNA (uracil2634-N3)-methyltransferase
MGKKLRGRQGYKAARGKGKGSLVHAAKLARKRKNERQQEISKKRKIENMKLEKRRESRRKNAYCPYHIEDTILLVGEGNFSFARALVRRFNGVATRLIATCYDTKEEVTRKYPEYPNILEELETAGVSIVYGVDCTALESNKDLRIAIETMQLSCRIKTDALNTGVSVFDKIVFNFPHTACGIKDTLENNRIHQRFLTSFFHSATKMLRPTSIMDTGDNGQESRSSSSSSSSSSSTSVGGNSSKSSNNNINATNSRGVKSRVHQFGLSQIHVTLKTGEPYSSWQIPRMAKLTGKLRLQTAIDFYPSMYSGYEHRRTLGGYRSSRNTTENVDVGSTKVEVVAGEVGDYPGLDWTKAVLKAPVVVEKKKPIPNKTLEANNDIVGARTYIFIKGIQAMEDEKFDMEKRMRQAKYDQEVEEDEDDTDEVI